MAALGLLLVGASSCTGGAQTESWRARIGDEATCDPAEAGCWREADRRALVGVRALAFDEPAEAARRLALELGHKLDDAEREALEDAGAPAVEALRGAVLGRLEADMVRAYMTPVAESIEALADEAECEGCAAIAGDRAAAVPIPSAWPEGVRAAVARIAEAGVFGQALATMLVTGGALDRDYVHDNAILFGEHGDELSIESRVERIVDHAENQSTWAGAVTGAETLVPIAGIAVSIAHEEWWMLAIHVEMILRIGAVYGWDLTDEATMLAALSIVMQDGLLPEGTDLVVAGVAVPTIMEQAETRFGLWTAGRIGSFLALKAGQWIVTMLRKRAATELTEQVVRQGGKAIAQQVLGWLTAGAGIAIGAIGDRVLTTVLGRRAAETPKRWLGDLEREGSTYLAEAEARDCAFAALAKMVVADGAHSSLEVRLHEAFAARRVWTSDDSSWLPGPSDRAARAASLRAATDGEDPDLACVGVLFTPMSGAARRTLLASTFAIAAIDGEIEPEERTLQDELRATLDRGWVTLSPLDVSLVDQIEDTIQAEVALPESDVGRDAGLTLEDVVPALR